MSRIRLDKKVPIPDPLHLKYHFRDMKVGDSFFTETDSVSAAACMYGKKYSMKFKTRKVIENGKEGRRVWRIA